MANWLNKNVGKGYDEGDKIREITTWVQFINALYHYFEAYGQEDCFLALKNMKQQSTLAYYSSELH